MNEKGAIFIPVEEDQPLLNNLVQGETPQGCSRGIFCKRCVVGKHENSRKRVFIRRTFAAMLLAWLYYSVFGNHRPGIKSNEGHGGDRHGDQCHKDDLIPWNGPSQFETTATNIDFRFGKGNMFTSVKILSNNDIEYPTIVVHANVSKTHGEDRGEEFQNDELVVLDANTKEVHHHGLHIHVREDDSGFEIGFWADEYIYHGHNHSDHPSHYPHHRRKFCVTLEAQIFLPESFTKFGRLSIEGKVMDLSARDVANIAFEKLEVTSTVGEIVFQDNVIASHFSAMVTSGAVTVHSITAPAGSPLKARVWTTVGAIAVNVVLPQISVGAEDQKHEVSIATTTGAVQLDVKPANTDGSIENTVPGEAHIDTNSEVGQIRSLVELADGQVLFLDSRSTTGHIEATIGDKFLGTLQLQTDMGSTSVIEANYSASEIEFQKNTSRQKIGRKHLKKDQNGDDDADENEGEIVLRSGFGRAELIFV
ncbi:hypothetical protein EDD21DRAFT_368336 [Dissophora ornata]|nr:hypothetical protein EDD21DRAFT_368336 [Dissophora ornata]